jgi:hypothetical protein
LQFAFFGPNINQLDKEKNMRIIRRLTSLLALTIVLGLSAFAGQIETGVVDPAPPPVTGDMYTPTASSTEPGEVQTPGAVATAESQTSFTELAADMLQSLLSLF